MTSTFFPFLDKSKFWKHNAAIGNLDIRLTLGYNLVPAYLFPQNKDRVLSRNSGTRIRMFTAKPDHN